MIAFITLGSNDLDRSGRFYDAVLEPLGISRIVSTDGFIVWGDGDGPALSLNSPYDGRPATAGNGTMVAIEVATNDIVDAAYAAALAHGGSDEGAPGPRGTTGYYGYFRDPDGNKLTITCPTNPSDVI